MDRYTQVLQELIKNTGLEGASLVSADGLPIASVLKPYTTQLSTSFLNHKLLLFLSLNALTSCTLPKLIHTS